MSQQASFFTPSVYQKGPLRSIDALSPRATPGQQRKPFAYLGLAAQTATIVALTIVLPIPEHSVAGSERVQVLRPFASRARFVAPRKSQLETVDHRRVQMKPRQVLVFRPVVSPRKATPRAFRDDAAE